MYYLLVLFFIFIYLDNKFIMGSELFQGELLYLFPVGHIEYHIETCRTLKKKIPIGILFQRGKMHTLWDSTYYLVPVILIR